MRMKLNIPLPSKGLVVDRPAEYVDQRGSTANKNMEYNRGIIRKRLGTATEGASLGERVLRYFELQVGNQTRLFRVGLTKVEVLNKSASTWASVANAALTGTASDVVSHAFPLLSGAKIATFTNGIDNIRKCSITGNDADLGGSPPKCRYLVSFGPYLVLLYVIDGGTTYYSRVQWCDTGDPETWTGGNAGSEDLIEDPDDITGGGVFGNFLTVHKANSIYLGQLVTTSDVFRFDRRATGVGAIAGATITNIPTGEQIFLASDGLHLFNGVTAPLIESPIQDEIREDMNPEYAFTAQGIFVEELDEYWVAVPTGSDEVPQTIYKYNWKTRQVYKDTRTNLTALGTFLDTQEDTWNDRTGTWNADTTRWNSVVNLANSPGVITGTSAGVSALRSAATYDDSGTAVEGLFETKDFTAEDFGIPDTDTMMRWKGLETWAIGSAVTVSYSTDGGTTWTSAGSLTLSSSYPTDASPLNTYFDVVSSRIRFRFANSTTEQTFTVKKYIVEATRREARR